MKHIFMICLMILAAVPVRAEFGLSNVVRKEIHHSPGVQEAPVPERPAANAPAPALEPAPGAMPAPGAPFTKLYHYPYTIHLSSWQDGNDALRQYERIRAKMDPLFVTKIDLGPSGIWYRMDYGVFRNIKEAVLKLQDLKAKGLVDKGAFVGGSVPYAIELGQFRTMEDAKERGKGLEDKGVITYVVKEQEDLYRLLAGAYPDEKSAGAQLNDLMGKNLNPVVKKR